MQLTDILYYFDLIFISLIISSLILNFPILLILHLLMPKAILTKYFKPPYFGSTEIEFFSRVPFFFIRTVMFLTVLAFPHRGKLRQLTEAYRMVPNWYRYLSKFYVITLVSTMSSLLLLILIGGVYYTYTGQIEW